MERERRSQRMRSKAGMDRPPGTGDEIMDRQARREQFEKLCQLRDRYQRLRPIDTRNAITIEAMIERATQLLERPMSALIVLNDGSSQANPTAN